MLPLILAGIGLAALGIAEVQLRKREKARTAAQNADAVKGEKAIVDIAKNVPPVADSSTSANSAPDDGAPPTQ